MSSADTVSILLLPKQTFFFKYERSYYLHAKVQICVTLRMTT